MLEILEQVLIRGGQTYSAHRVHTWEVHKIIFPNTQNKSKRVPGLNIFMQVQGSKISCTC